MDSQKHIVEQMNADFEKG